MSNAQYLQPGYNCLIERCGRDSSCIIEGLSVRKTNQTGRLQVRVRVQNKTKESKVKRRTHQFGLWRLLPRELVPHSAKALTSQPRQRKVVEWNTTRILTVPSFAKQNGLTCAHSGFLIVISITRRTGNASLAIFCEVHSRILCTTLRERGAFDQVSI